MNEKEELTKRFQLVDMDEVKISTVEKPIIGTQALATCVGILLYSEKYKKAIVGHVSDHYFRRCIAKSLELVDENELYMDKINYLIIGGYYHNHYNLKEKLEDAYKNIGFIPFEKEKIKNGIRIHEETTSLEFAFDSVSGEFVTDKVYFGSDYLDELEKKYK